MGICEQSGNSGRSRLHHCQFEDLTVKILTAVLLPHLHHEGVNVCDCVKLTGCVHGHAALGRRR